MNTLNYAIRNEADAAKYYSEQAQAHTGTTLNKVFSLLAEEEQQHEAILQQVLLESYSDLVDNPDLVSKDSIFSGLESFKDEIRENPTQVEVYRLGREMEQKSIDLYREMAADAKNEKEKAVFHYLIKQEMRHYELMDEFVIRIGRADEWVESAEFGTREEY